MSRKRSISTDISTDSRVNELSNGAALFYTWMIPHANDDCRLTPRNAKELQLLVVPGRNWTLEEVENYILEIRKQCLLGIDDDGKFFLPSDSFYKYQTYINSNKRQETPRITASPSPSPSPSYSYKNKNPEPASPEPSADSAKAEKKKLDPRIKEIATKVYETDKKKFDRLVVWIKQAEKEHFSVDVIVAALERFLPYARDIVQWYPYLDKLIYKCDQDINRDRHEAEHRKHKEEIRELSNGPIYDMVARLADAKSK